MQYMLMRQKAGLWRGEGYWKCRR